MDIMTRKKGYQIFFTEGGVLRTRRPSGCRVIKKISLHSNDPKIKIKANILDCTPPKKK